jgi:hypothetical protein
MDHDAIRAVIEAEIKLKFATAQPGVPMRFANTKFDNPQGPWIYIAVIPNLDKRANIGGFAEFAAMGVVNVACMVLEGTGEGPVGRIADDVAMILADRQLPVPPIGHVTCCNIQRRTRGVVNGFYTVNILCEYRARVRIER